MRVQVAVPRHLGDAVLALPALRLLARSASVVVRADGGAALVLAEQGPFELAADRGASWEPVPTLLLAGSLRVALKARFAGAPVRLGRPTDRRSLLLTHRVSEPRPALPSHTPDGHERSAMLPAEHQRVAWMRAAGEFSQVLGLASGPEQQDDQLLITREDQARADEWLVEAGGPSVLLHPWAAGLATKRWPEAKWRALGEELQAAGERIAVTGGPDPQDTECASALGAALGATVAAGASTLPPRVWAAAARSVRAVVLPDTGLSHVAVAAGAQAVVIFGSTDPARHRPLGPGRARLLQVPDLSCGPCYRSRCRGPKELACLAHHPAAVAAQVLA